ncbi:hypothetical protein [Mycobacterium sp. JS623]|uniref:hypothetical protein n=1 Tax=Mycobacterium sp. JS623 TaxID=212767 RepID=UPI0002DA66E3|nr:hypothetical protein [Mycobacterium sp. JS623]
MTPSPLRKPLNGEVLHAISVNRAQLAAKVAGESESHMTAAHKPSAGVVGADQQ